MISSPYLRRFFINSTCALLVACVATISANAYTISIVGTSNGNPGGQPLYKYSGLVVGDSFNMLWGGVPGLSVAGTVTIDALTATTADIHVTLDNNNTPLSGVNPRVTSVGVLIDNYTSIADNDTGGTHLDSAEHSNFPGFSTLTCATSGNNCAGGGSGGVPVGGSDDFVLKVNGTFAGSINLARFGLKIQGGPNGPDGDSYELAGYPGVPEPTSLALFALAATPLSLRRRRSR